MHIRLQQPVLSVRQHNGIVYSAEYSKAQPLTAAEQIPMCDYGFPLTCGIGITELCNLYSGPRGILDIFVFDMESYVTYMEEDILSVIYVEYAYLDDQTYESYVVSVNIDMDSGMEMTNSQILEIDDEFSIDFRKRSEKQNGQSETMDYYTDQEITSMMNDDSTLIIFYTPLGMEVGFNYYYGWVTVTYPDYAKYQNPL